jgi:hypothetical protein
MIYLLYMSLMKTSCETMINLSSGQRNVNQYITFTDKNNENYVMIRLKYINDAELKSKLYELTSSLIPDAFIGQNTANIIKSLKNNKYVDINKEPIFLIKSSDAKTLTNNHFISGAVRDVKQRTIIVPYDSHLNNTSLNGTQYERKLIKLDNLLFLNTVEEPGTEISEMQKLYLQELYNYNNIKIYIPRQNGDDINKILLF